MAMPRAYKTDESFLEKIAIGATGTRRVFEDLASQSHRPLELERGSMGFKIWKTIKIKRVRVPDILCLRCARRVESRAKTRLEISMSHSTTNPERGWDAGLEDTDAVGLVHCEKAGPGPLDWSAGSLIQYTSVADLRRAWRERRVILERPKGAQEGFEVRAVWPTALARGEGRVEEVQPGWIRYQTTAGRRLTAKLLRQHGGESVALQPTVTAGQPLQASQIIAAVVPVGTQFPCGGDATVETYLDLIDSVSLSDRYTAAKALGQFANPAASEALLHRMADDRDHIYVQAEAAAGLMRRGHAAGQAFLERALGDEYLPHRLEAVTILGEVATGDAVALLLRTLSDGAQHPEIRAGAAWALGEIGTEAALPALVASFEDLAVVIRMEAARALAKIARLHLPLVLNCLPESKPEQRAGIAWALSKAGGFTIDQLLPSLTDEDARQWTAYIIGSQNAEAMVPEIEALATQDPEVYFAVTMLWKIMASWVYGLEEY